MSPRVGLVGFGLAGRVLHLPLLEAAGCEITAVVSSQREQVAQRLPRARCCADVDELLARADAELVVIASPNHLHATQALQALAAGRHVVVDKPFAATLAQADAVLRAAAAANRQLAVFHNRRWDADFLTLRAVLDSGRLGTLHTLQLRWERFRPQVAARWREQADAAGGVLNDLGAHLLDQALQLLGRPQWLYAQLLSQRAGAVVEDGCELLLQMGAVTVMLGVSSVAAGPAPRIRALGSAGSFESRAIDVQEAQLRAGLSPLAADFGVMPPADWPMLQTGENGPLLLPAVRGNWLEFYRRVVAAIRVGGPMPVGGAQGREVIELIAAARRSHFERRRIALAGATS